MKSSEYRHRHGWWEWISAEYFFWKRVFGDAVIELDARRRAGLPVYPPCHHCLILHHERYLAELDDVALFSREAKEQVGR